MFNTTSNSTATLNGTGGITLGTTCPTTTYVATSGTTIYGGLTLNHNTTSMNQQVKVAVFQVTRNKYNEIKTSTFIDEFWIEKKTGISIDFAVAKKLAGKYEADEIVIKEVYTVTL